jgi:hypothetical protein
MAPTPIPKMPSRIEPMNTINEKRPIASTNSPASKPYASTRHEAAPTMNQPRMKKTSPVTSLMDARRDE